MVARSNRHISRDSSLRPPRPSRDEAMVAVSPGIAFGEHGDGHVRISLVENRQRIRQAARNVKTFFGRYDQASTGTERRRAVVS